MFSTTISRRISPSRQMPRWYGWKNTCCHIPTLPALLTGVRERSAVRCISDEDHICLHVLEFDEGFKACFSCVNIGYMYV